MYTIKKEFSFSAGHHLNGLPKNHPCSQKHGHNYVIELTFSSRELNKTGFVIDYRKLDKFKKHLNKVYDHRYLNDIFSFNPTAENLAKHFFDLVITMFPQLTAVTIKETDKTSATYEIAFSEIVLHALENITWTGGEDDE